MKSYLSLIPISAKVHRRQSRMTRICIILAVFLVTAIFSLLEMWTNGQITAMRSNHGDWHIVLQNMPEDKAEQIIDNSDVAYSSWYDVINENVQVKCLENYNIEDYCIVVGFGDVLKSRFLINNESLLKSKFYFLWENL